MTPPSDTSQAALANAESGSFRDPESRIFYADGAVYRALSPDGLADFEALAETKLFDAAVGRRPPGGHRAHRGHRLAARPARARARRGAQARADPVRVLPLRVAVLDAQGRRPAPAGPARGVAERGPDAQGRVLLQRPVPGRPADLRRRRQLRAPARGRGLGRLPPVLHAVPVPADAPGAQGRGLPRRAARPDRRHQPAADAQPVDVPRPLPQGLPVQRLHPRAPGGQVRRPRRTRSRAR